MAWQTVPFAGDTFKAERGHWVVDQADQVAYAYHVTDDVLTVVFQIDQTTVSDLPQYLRLRLPDGVLVGQTAIAVVRIQNNGAWGAGLAIAFAGQNELFFFPDMTGTTHWSSGFNQTAVQGTCVIPLQVASAVHVTAGSPTGK